MTRNLGKVTRSRYAALESQPVPVPRRGGLLVAMILLAAIVAAFYEGAQASHHSRQVQVLTERVQQLQRERDEALGRLSDSRARRTPSLPAPPMPVAGPSEALPAESLPSTNFYARFKDRAPKLSAEQDWMSYVDRIKSSGEEAALRWAVAKDGRK